MSPPPRVDVLVVGAGIAGLCAARELAGSGLSVAVFDARRRPGGRILTEHLDGWPWPLELGAEFVHGCPAELVGLVRDAGLELESADAMHAWRGPQGLEPIDGFWAEIAGLIDGLRGAGPDLPAGEQLARAHLSPRAGELLALFIEGFHAAALERISWQSVVRQMPEGAPGQWRIAGGYGRLVDFVADDAARRGARLLLDSPVDRLSWRRGAVAAQVLGRTWRATAAVVALPHAVLSAPPSTGLRLEPEVPALRQALAALETGQVMRLVVRLRAPLWSDDLPPASFVHASPASVEMPTCWIAGDCDHPQVTLWCGGARAHALGTLAQGDLEITALRSLATLFGRPLAEVAGATRSLHLHGFERDPCSRGAYPFQLAGARLDGGFDPVAGTLFVAGDFTDPAELGTVGAAVHSGMAAARGALAALGAERTLSH